MTISWWTRVAWQGGNQGGQGAEKGGKDLGGKKHNEHKSQFDLFDSNSPICNLPSFYLIARLYLLRAFDQVIDSGLTLPHLYLE